MEIWHRVGFNVGLYPDFRATLDRLEIKYEVLPLPGRVEGLICFDISESDCHWVEIAKWIRISGASDMVNSVFSREEILNAEWLRLVPVFEQGYPQPQATWVRDPINYADHCLQCGTYRQIESFRMKGEPNLGRNDFVSLYWTYALFCTPRVVEELKTHQLKGFEAWDVIIPKRQTRSEKVVQLFIPGITNPGLVQADELQTETCPLCHVTKYYPHKRGVMQLKRGALLPDVDFMKTYEWFGSGHSAYREIIVSNRCARLILEEAWKGVSMKVVKAV